MSVRSWYRTGVMYLRDGAAYLRHRISGSSYSEYYAERMNRIIRRNPSWGLNLNKKFQLDYLVAHGLTPTNSLLDYGCGALAAGALFVEYLDAANYVGLDISSEAIAEGRRRLEAKGLMHKKPALYRIESATLTVLGGRQFDVIWAQSVFTHMPPDDISKVLRHVRKHMHRSSKFYATFARTDGESHQERFKDWYYPLKFFVDVAHEHGLRVQFMSDWHHPDDPARKDTLAQFSLNPAAQP